jgi:branched-chain amino acid transport system substrate-binding protein
MTFQRKGAVVNRRTVLKGMGAAGAIGALGFPAIVRAQVKEIKIGSVQPMTGLLAVVGKTTRQGNQLAVDHVNAEGGIKSMGGAQLVLVPGDHQYKPEVARAETERLMREGCHFLIGAFDSGSINAMIQVIKQSAKPVPFVIDIGSADQLTQQGVKYVFRVFTTNSTMGRRGIEYLMQLFKDTGDPCKRAVMFQVSDLFGQVGRERTMEWHKKLNAPFEVAEIITYPAGTQDLSTEVAKAKSLKPDMILAITRPNDAILLVQELYKQRVDIKALVGPGNPGFYQPTFVRALGKLAEHTMANAPWWNPKSPLGQKVAADYEKRFADPFTTESAWSYQGVRVIADVLERAGTVDPDKFVEAARKTNIKDHVVSGGPIQFDESGDNVGASSSMVQIRDGRPKVIFPKEAAEVQPVYPIPKLWERG